MGIWKIIKLFFTKIDYPALWKSVLEVFWMTFIALFPLIVNILISWISQNDIEKAFQSRIIPGEILSYCLSFIAPSLYLLTKLHGTTYRLPFLHLFSILTILIYILTIVLYIIAKNHYVNEINFEKHNLDVYFKTTLVFLGITVLFRVYTIYHGKISSNWSQNRLQQQQDFDSVIKKRIKEK